MEEVFHRRSKNQLLRFPVPPDETAVSCDWTLERAGMDGPSPLGSPPPPPPRRGFAILDPPKLNPPESEDARPRVEPALAASKRSLTAVSCASNLFEQRGLVMRRMIMKGGVWTVWMKPTGDSLLSTFLGSPEEATLSSQFAHF